MSAEGQEELLDYSDSEEIAVPSTTAPTTTDEATTEKDADKRVLMLVFTPLVSEIFY